MTQNNVHGIPQYLHDNLADALSIFLIFSWLNSMVIRIEH